MVELPIMSDIWEHFFRDEQELMVHIEDDLRMETRIEHTVSSCQCKGNYCYKCEKLLCVEMFYVSKGKVQKPCRVCRDKRTKLIREHPELKFQPPDIRARFLAKVDIQPGQCWLWKGHISPYGYGILTNKKIPRGAHRISYELYKGPIPRGMHVDHLCCVRHCVNPEHLEAVTPSVNSLRVWVRRREKRMMVWKELYCDLYREVYGDVTQEAWKTDAERRRNLLGLPDPRKL